MAVIGNIRRRSGLLIIIIGLAMLAFILGDIFGNGGLMGGQQGPAAVGNIAGTEVNQMDLEKRTEYWNKIGNSYYGSSTEEQSRRRAWDDIVFQNVMAQEIEEAGVSFTAAEFDELRFGDNVLPEIKTGEIYKGEDGQFDPERVTTIWKSWSENVPELWTAERNRIKRSRITAKYNELISKGMISNSLEAADSYANKNVTMDLQYVVKPFSSIVDSLVTVSDADLSGFFNAHKGEARFQQIAGRDVELISFPVVATADDINNMREDLGGLKAEFQESENDSIFASNFSDTKRYSAVSYTRDDLTPEQADDVFSAANGSVVGPYQDGKNFRMFKVIGNDTKEEASVQHILLNSEQEDATISSRADSILKALKRGADFDALAAKYSQDPGYASNKGLYENFGKGQMVPEFETFAFEENVGAMGVVKTNFGYHIMEVLDRKTAPQKKVVELMKFIRPSSETLDVAYDLASNFSIDNSSLEKFRSAAAEAGYTVKPQKSIAPSAKVVGGIANSRAITRWAYNADRKVGEISQPMEFDDQFVIVALTGSREEGAPTLDGIREQLRAEVIKEKKAEMMIAELGSVSGLDQAASTWAVAVSSAPGVSLNSPNLGGTEPAVVGEAYGSESGSVTGPVVGNAGVYVVQIDNRTAVDTESVDLSSESRSLQNAVRGTVASQLAAAINKARGVKNDIDRIY